MKSRNGVGVPDRIPVNDMKRGPSRKTVRCFFALASPCLGSNPTQAPSRRRIGNERRDSRNVPPFYLKFRIVSRLKITKSSLDFRVFRVPDRIPVIDTK